MSADESRPVPRPEPVYDPGTAPAQYQAPHPGGHQQPAGWDAPAQLAGWDAPAQPRPRRRWSTGKMIAAAALAVVVAAGGGAAVYAAANAAKAQAAGTTSIGGRNNIGGTDDAGGRGSGGPDGGDRPGGFDDGDMGPGGMGAGLQSALHGEYVVQNNGSYVTMLTQTGDVTAVSAASLTVKSADGVTQTFAVSSSASISGVLKGSTVRVTGTNNGNTATATEVELVPSASGSPAGSN